MTTPKFVPSTDALIKKLEKLSKLSFDNVKLRDEFGLILGHISSLDEVDVQNIKPMFHACIEDYEFAKDEVEVFDSELITKTSPYIKEHFFCVPSILEEEN